MAALAILGRPNVGKSTLFNRILGKTRAIVHDQPGVTRDWQLYKCVFEGVPLSLYDTPGVETDPSLLRSLSIDGILWVLDGQQGVTGIDQTLASFLRKQPIPIIVVVNKCENIKVQEAVMSEVARLGMGEPVFISARHGQGMMSLAHSISKLPNSEVSSQSLQEEGPRDDILTVIMGRPNAGKSSLVNAFLGYERMSTGPQAGITTDAVVTQGEWKGKKISIVDTAGLRKNFKGEDMLEKLAVKETTRALVFAHIAIIVIDTSEGIQRQDLVIADKAHQEGRSVIIALNKWDQVDAPKELLKDAAYVLGKYPIVPISCKNSQGLDKLWDQVLTSYAQWNERLSTGPLNRWLARQIIQNPPPMYKNHRIKIKYMTQIKSRPPTFSLFGYRVKSLPESYQRYLLNAMTREFQFSSLRLVLNDTQNPYDKKSS
jgi:GTP-binding protein